VTTVSILESAVNAEVRLGGLLDADRVLAIQRQGDFVVTLPRRVTVLPRSVRRCFLDDDACFSG
jgi:hypothetical protein